MKRILMSPALAFALTLLPQPAPAEDTGSALMRRGLELFMDGLQEELAPTLKDLDALTRDLGPSLKAFLDEMGPGLVRLLAQVKDWSVYEPPELLPNGDIILRRKVPLKPAPQPSEPAPDDKTPSDDAIDL